MRDGEIRDHYLVEHLIMRISAVSCLGSVNVTEEILPSHVLPSVSLNPIRCLESRRRVAVSIQGCCRAICPCRHTSVEDLEQGKLQMLLLSQTTRDH